MNKNLNNTFNIPIEDNSCSNIAPVSSSDIKMISEEDREQDLEYVRQSLQFTMEQAKLLVGLAIENASNEASPRDVEVACNALNTCADVSHKLLDIHEKAKKLRNVQSQIDNGSNNTFINGDSKIVVTTTADLLKQLANEE